MTVEQKKTNSKGIEIVNFDPTDTCNYLVMSPEEFCNATDNDIEDILDSFGDSNGDFIAIGDKQSPFFVCEFEGYLYFVCLDADTDHISSAFTDSEVADESEFSVNVFDGMQCRYDTYFFNV
jgi:hypothetical protein